jgi:hypothetical protein
MYVCKYRVAKQPKLLSVVTVQGDAQEARAQAARKAAREQEIGIAYWQVQPGVWLGCDLEGVAFAIVAGAKPMEYLAKEESRRTVEKVTRNDFK